MPFLDFEANQVLSAAQVDTFLMRQTVMVFDDAAARDTALAAVLVEGMLCYLKDTDEVLKYDGSEWVVVGNDLSTGTAGFTAISNGASGLSYQPVSHNYIINGAFDFWQRGTSLSGALADNVYLADRWKNIWTGAGNPTDVTVSQETFTPAEVEAIGYGEGQFYQNMTITTIGSAESYRIEHDIEDVRTLAGQEVTISFWVKANASYSITGQPFQLFGSGGSGAVPNSPFTFSQTTTSTTWTRVTGTTTISSISGKTIGTGSKLLVRLDFGTGADGDEISIWGLQLEAGSIATPFKRNANSIQGELAACQRYYQRFTSAGASGTFLGYTNVAYTGSTSALGVLPHRADMRANPTLSSGGSFQNFGASTLAVSAIGLSRASKSHTAIFTTVSGATTGQAALLRDSNDATAFIDLSAEL